MLTDNDQIRKLSRIICLSRIVICLHQISFLILSKPDDFFSFKIEF